MNQRLASITKTHPSSQQRARTRSLGWLWWLPLLCLYAGLGAACFLLGAPVWVCPLPSILGFALCLAGPGAGRTLLACASLGACGWMVSQTTWEDVTWGDSGLTIQVETTRQDMQKLVEKIWPARQAGRPAPALPFDLGLPSPAGGREGYLEALAPRDPAIRKLAVERTRPCRARDQGCEMASLLKYVGREIKYVSDPRGDRDYIQPVAQTLDLKAGDCEDQTILLASMLESVGIRTLMAFTDDHVYTLACPEEKPARRWLARAATTLTVEQGGTTRRCYPLEPTAPSARVGQVASKTPLVALLDPVTRTAVSLPK